MAAEQPPAGQLITSGQYLAAYMAMRAQLRAQVVAVVAGMWAELQQWRTPDIDGFAARAAPVVTAGQAQMAALVDGYIAQIAAAAGAGTGVPAGVSGPGVIGAAVRNGADPLTVYRRPGETVWYRLSQGDTLDQAVAAGAARARILAATDMQLTSTHAARQALVATPRVTGYRRVLTGGHSCGLCVVASTQRYRTADLMPIHPGCDCIVEPIVGDSTAGQVIDPGRLDAVKQRLGPDVNLSDTAALRSQLIVHHNGELGPVLAVRGQHFTGPAELADAA